MLFSYEEICWKEKRGIGLTKPITNYPALCVSREDRHGRAKDAIFFAGFAVLSLRGIAGIKDAVHSPSALLAGSVSGP